MTRADRARGVVTELKIPAQPSFVLVAKRAASALGSCAGFSLEGIDDLNIAVAQACEKAIAASDRTFGQGNAILKLSFKLVDAGIELEIRSQPGRAAISDEAVLRHEVDLERRAESMRRAAALLSQEVAVERRERLRAAREAQRLRQQLQAEPVGRRPSVAGRALQPRAAEVSQRELEDVAVNMIRLFVDELRYHVDSHGSMRMRMVKYLVE